MYGKTYADMDGCMHVGMHACIYGCMHVYVIDGYMMHTWMDANTDACMHLCMQTCKAYEKG